MVLGLVLTWLICVSPAAFADPVNGAAHAAAQACNPGNAVFCGLFGGGGGAGGGAGAGGAGGAGGAAAAGGGAGGAAARVVERARVAQAVLVARPVRLARAARVVRVVARPAPREDRQQQVLGWLRIGCQQSRRLHVRRLCRDDDLRHVSGPSVPSYSGLQAGSNLPATNAVDSFGEKSSRLGTPDRIYRKACLPEQYPRRQARRRVYAI